MPAPSPARGSAPTAPRCSRLQRIVQRVLDDLVRLAALDVGDEADAAGILVERGIVEARACGHAGIGAVANNQTGVAPLHRRSVVLSFARRPLRHHSAVCLAAYLATSAVTSGDAEYRSNLSKAALPAALPRGLLLCGARTPPKIRTALLSFRNDAKFCPWFQARSTSNCPAVKFYCARSAEVAGGARVYRFSVNGGKARAVVRFR